MARNGSGVYTPPAASYPAVSGTLIEAAKFNAVIDDMSTALTESVAINGQTMMTGDLVMGSHKITGLTDGVAASDACAYGQAGSAAIAATYAATGKTTPVDADVLPLSDSAASFGLKKLTWANLKATVYAALGVLTAAGTDKATPADADVFMIGDSAATNATKKLTWANIKATIFTAFGVLTAAGTDKTTPVDADVFVIGDSAASNATKKLTWANIKATLQLFGVGQTWQDMLASRTSGTPVTNSSGKPIMVCVWCANPGASIWGATLVVTVDGITILSTSTNSSYTYPSVSFIVPNGITYSVSSAGGAMGIAGWAELR